MFQFKWFYNVSWSLQLAVGLILFVVTAVLEAIVLASYLESLWLGVFVAGGLEAAKVLTIVLYRMLNGQAEVPYPGGVRWITLSFRGMLFALSAACSVMFLAQHLDRPGMEQVPGTDLAAAERQYRARPKPPPRPAIASAATAPWPGSPSRTGASAKPSPSAI